MEVKKKERARGRRRRRGDRRERDRERWEERWKRHLCLKTGAHGSSQVNFPGPPTSTKKSSGV